MIGSIFGSVCLPASSGVAFLPTTERGEESPKGDSHDIAQFITPSEGHLHENSVSRNALTGSTSSILLC